MYSLQEAPPDTLQTILLQMLFKFEYQMRHQGGLKMVLTRVSAGRPLKPAPNS